MPVKLTDLIAAVDDKTALEDADPAEVARVARELGEALMATLWKEMQPTLDVWNRLFKVAREDAAFLNVDPDDPDNAHLPLLLLRNDAHQLRELQKRYGRNIGVQWSRSQPGPKEPTPEDDERLLNEWAKFEGTQEEFRELMGWRSRSPLRDALRRYKRRTGRDFI